MEHYDIIIVGGGLAGLTAALHLKAEGHAVLVFEKQDYPHHKVCGEYVSNEVVPYLKRLGITLDSANSVAIHTLRLSTQRGKALRTQLPLGGKGISRYHLDHLLFQRARSIGVLFKMERVTNVHFEGHDFTVTSASGTSIRAKVVIGAFGKRSALDKRLKRPFIQEKSPWLGVKAHYEYDAFPENEVALHNFEGGYGGLSKTESGAVNFCYLARYSSFKKHQGISDFNTKVVGRNPFLAHFLSKAKPLFPEPLAIAQISFAQKEAVGNHILMCGDSAGLIHPLCGNGMAMAIHSAKLASEQIHSYLGDPEYSRRQMELRYQRQWQSHFAARMRTGRWLQSLLLNPNLSDMAMKTIVQSSFLTNKIIQRTHGIPIV